VAGFLLGGDDHVTKPFEPDELMARVRRAITRTRQPKRFPSSKKFRLTPREQEILGLFAAGLGTQAVSEQLQISTKRSAVIRSGCFRSSAFIGGTEAVALAYREGLFETAGAPRA
jgi:FixJ family two-component response regulator